MGRQVSSLFFKTDRRIIRISLVTSAYPLEGILQELKYQLKLLRLRHSANHAIGKKSFNWLSEIPNLCT